MVFRYSDNRLDMTRILLGGAERHGCGQSVAKTSEGGPPASQVRSRAGRPGAAACAELRSALARRRVVADRTQLADRTGEVGDSRVPADKRTARAHNQVVADRSREVGHSRAAPHKRAAVAHNPAVAEPPPAGGRKPAATPAHTAGAPQPRG